jgi:hypothetical protein
MKLSQCKYGVIVYRQTYINIKPLIGMVVGIGQNRHKEAIPLVQWQDRTTPIVIHHGCIDLYEE